MGWDLRKSAWAIERWAALAEHETGRPQLRVEVCATIKLNLSKGEIEISNIYRSKECEGEANLEQKERRKERAYKGGWEFLLSITVTLAFRPSALKSMDCNIVSFYLIVSEHEFGSLWNRIVVEEVSGASDSFTSVREDLSDGSVDDGSEWNGLSGVVVWKSVKSQLRRESIGEEWILVRPSARFSSVEINDGRTAAERLRRGNE